jgi:hypothetical protein
MLTCSIFQDADYCQSDLCETTDGVRSYSGYVHLPAGALADLGVQNQTYEINTFFWFFESRKDPANAPLSIWMVRNATSYRGQLAYCLSEWWSREQLHARFAARERTLLCQL